MKQQSDKLEDSRMRRGVFPSPNAATGSPWVWWRERLRVASYSETVVPYISISLKDAKCLSLASAIVCVMCAVGKPSAYQCVVWSGVCMVCKSIGFTHKF